MILKFTDRLVHDFTSRRYTNEGFLIARGRVARTGIQEYYASEMGLGGDPLRVVNVYRPPEEVFAIESLRSYDAVDITIDHPDEFVNSANYSTLTCGVVGGGGVQVGDFVECDLYIKSQDAIDTVNSGVVQLSVGYTAEYDNTPGESPEGLSYEFVQRNIIVNHVAIVRRARAGNQARILDKKPSGGRMPVIVTLDSGLPVDVTDPVNAQAVADSFARLTKKLADEEVNHKLTREMLDSVADANESLTAKSSDEAIAARISGLSKAHAGARKVAGIEFTCDSLDPVEIMKKAMSVIRPDMDWNGKSGEYIQAAFDVYQMEAEEEPVTSNDQLKVLSKDAAGVTKDTAPVLSRAQLALMKQTGKGA